MLEFSRASPCIDLGFSMVSGITIEMSLMCRSLRLFEVPL